MHFSWSEILSIISFVFSSITTVTGTYVFIQRKFKIKTQRLRAFIPKCLPTSLHVVVTVINQSSLPIAITNAYIDGIEVVYKTRMVSRIVKEEKVIPNSQVYTSKFPVNIAPYESVNLYLEFDSENFEIKNYQLKLITSRQSKKFLLKKCNVSYDKKFIGVLN